MRKAPTEAEKVSIAALLNFCNDEGAPATPVPRDSEDKPDALFEWAGTRIACECIQVPPEYIYQQQYKKRDQGAWNGKPILTVLCPNEPHLWVAEAIQKKTKLHAGYLATTGAQKAWLLIHTPTHAQQFYVDDGKEWIRRAVEHGSKMVQHAFEQIFLWTPQDGIRRIWHRADDAGVSSTLTFDFSSGYPTLCTNQIAVPFRTLDPGEAGPRETLSEVFSDAEIISVPPKDPAFLPHQPAKRLVQYECRTLVWPDRAELKIACRFIGEEGEPELHTQKLENIPPGTQQLCHLVHEFRAPQRLRTQHGPMS